MSDYRQSEEYGRYFSANGWIVEKVDNTLVLVRKIPFLGSIIKIQRCDRPVPFSKVEALAQKHHALLVMIEANVAVTDPGSQELEKEFKEQGYKNLNFALCPTKTSLIDLNQTEGDLLSSFDRNVRKVISQNQKSGFTTTVTKSLIELYSLLKEAGSRRQFFVQSLTDWQKQWGAFGNRSQVILAYQNDQLLGANMTLLLPPVAYGLFLPTTEEGRQRQVSTTLVWEGFRLAKAAGCTTFDLEGLYDARYGKPKSWLGLTAFKRKFKGREVEFMPAKVKIYAWYLRPLWWFKLL